jgi:transcription initiation factor IIE alpha subunit
MDEKSLPGHIKLIQNTDSLYKNVIYECKFHGTITQLKRAFLKTSNCPKCLGRGLNTTDYINEFNRVHSGKYDYSLIKEITQKTTTIKIICSVHGVFEQNKQYHLHGSGCPKCVGKKLDATDKRLRVKNKNIDIDSIDFSKNQNDQIEVSCSKHGKFSTTLASLFNNSGCQKCRYEQSARTRRGERLTLIDELNAIHENKYLYSTSEYKGVKSFIDVHCAKHGPFSQAIYSHLAGHGCPKCSNLYNKFELYFQEKYGCIINDRSTLGALEIDVLFKDHSFGIEYNGLYWHSDEFKDKKYHLNKTELMEERGYQLFHIFEPEWINPVKRKIWESIIENKRKQTVKIHARKCTTREISAKESKEFLDINHMQGYQHAPIRIGLFYNDELVSLMTFSKPRFNKSVEYELVRFCSAINKSVVGAGSKLLRYFELKYQPSSIISYANRRWSQGNVYKKLGFEFVRNSEPNYFYFKTSKEFFSRNAFQKHKLRKKLAIYDERLSEAENMSNNGYRRIWDSGNMVFKKVYKEKND